MATLDQQGNVLPDTPIQELEEVTVTGQRLPVKKYAVDWNGILTALITAGALYLLNQLTKPARRRRRRA